MSDVAMDETEFTREVRLGLVLYGGVSLAIYMNGTTNELFRSVRGRGVYFLVKHLLNADITVDVASGASAGGINGIFLSFALANAREFGTCADLWRRDGDLGSLLRKLDGAETVPSVLDSAHYRDVLENGFRVMWENQTHPNEPEAPSKTNELDLFVAGTNFYGRYSQAVDSTGRVIETKQHRTTFWLKHRQRSGSKCQLDPRRDPYGKWLGAPPVEPIPGDLGLTLEEPVDPPPPDAGLLAFAKLAQLTSCFPGAFAPVPVTCASFSAGTELSEADQKLKVWGDLPVGEYYFVDGGVLDNKPFTTTLDTIFHRPAHRRVCRHVLYLEPDPERFSAETRDKRDAEGRVVAPSFVSSVADSLTRLPSYESIAEDLSRIAEHNASIQRFDELVKGLGQGGAAPPPTATYLSARLLAIGQRVNEELAEALASIEFHPLGGDGRTKTKLSMAVLGELLKRLMAAIQKAPVAPTPDLARKAERERGELLRRVDVDFYLRRLLALTYELERRSEEPGFTELWKHVNREIQRLEIVRHALERVVVPPRIWAGGDGFDAYVKGVDADALWLEILQRTLALLDYERVKEWMEEEPAFPEKSVSPIEALKVLERKDKRRAAFQRTLERQLETIQKCPTNELPPHDPKRTLLEVSDDRLAVLVKKSGCNLKEFFATFERNDALRFPLELAARVHQRDQISVVRMSPFDAQTGLSKRALEDKICGETFGHFGAFLKKSWRSNDILWGRLDGICRLVEMLLLHTKFASGNDEKPRLPDLNVQRVLGALGPEGQQRAFLGQLFPNLEARISVERARTRGAPADQLDRLLAAFQSQTEPADEYRQGIVDLLIETAQLDALAEELPKVIADAAEEQLDWGQRKVDGKLPSRVDPKADAEATSKAEKTAQKAEARARKHRSAARKADDEASRVELQARQARSKVRKAKLESEAHADRALQVSFWTEAWEFKANAVSFDPALLNLATRVFAEQALAGKSPAQLSEYFRQQYAVGSESALLAMPSTVLVDLGARAAVLAEHALVGSGAVGRTLRGNGLYRMVVRWPIRLIAELAAFLRRSPEFTQAIVVGSLLYAALALVTNVLWGGKLYADEGVRRGVAVWVFGILPLAALVVAWAIWRPALWKRVLVAVIASVLLIGAIALRFG
jgi:patatin-related protein